jgi:hypothetical protein
MRNSVNFVSNYKGKQTGAALMTVMVFLVLMTIVTVSATKISILDVLISGNDQQKIVAFQTAENNLTEFAQTKSLNDAFIKKGFKNPSQQFKTTDSTNALTKKITRMGEFYPCRRKGLGSSMGGGSPLCDLYDFQILQNKKSTGTRENHHRGSGKMVPQTGSKSSLI